MSPELSSDLRRWEQQLLRHMLPLRQTPSDTGLMAFNQRTVSIIHAIHVRAELPRIYERILRQCHRWAPRFLHEKLDNGKATPFAMLLWYRDLIRF